MKLEIDEYKCQCGMTWEKGELLPPLEFMENEGCPDCMKECERCGMLIGMDRNNWIEHCL